jgi:hypothetical protein
VSFCIGLFSGDAIDALMAWGNDGISSQRCKGELAMNWFKASQIGCRYDVDSILGQVRVIGPNALIVLTTQTVLGGTVVMFNDALGRDVTMIQDGVSAHWRFAPRSHPHAQASGGELSLAGQTRRMAIDHQLADYWCSVAASIHAADILQACRWPATRAARWSKGG